MKKAKSRQFSMRISTAERAQLQAIANHYGLTPSSVIRMLIREAERNQAAEEKPKLDHGAWSEACGFNVDA